jgi:hypothetical protein
MGAESIKIRGVERIGACMAGICWDSQMKGEHN